MTQKQKAKAFKEIVAFKRHAYVKVVTPDARYFVVEGIPDAAKQRDRILTTRDGASGKELSSLSVRVKDDQDYTGVTIDPTGRFLALSVPTTGGNTHTLLEMPSGKMVKPLTSGSHMSSGAKLWVSGPNESIYRDQHKPPLVTLDIDGLGTGCGAGFTSKDIRYVLGNRDGTVTIYDLEAIQRGLASARLGWE